MKKSILTLFVLFVCAIQTTTAYEYFTIYFSDGTKSEAFYATDVDSICYSKIGLDSIAYDDWQVQEIYTCDSVYRYPLAQIDSLSFKDVDVNIVAEDINRASSVIVPLYAQYESVADLSQHLSTIRNVEGVEDAWVDGQALHVYIRDYGTIAFIYPPKTSVGDASRIKAMKMTASKSALTSTEQNQTGIGRVCIFNHMAKDDNPGFNDARWVVKELKEMYDKMDISCDVPDKVQADFFVNRMFDYDQLFLITHGDYDLDTNSHWLATDEEILCIKDKNYYYYVDEFREFLNKKAFYSSNKLKIMPHKEIRNKKDTCIVFYVAVSEHLIASSKNHFKNPNTIVFNAACESLKGYLSQHGEKTVDYSMGTTFVNKGASCYFGYDDTNRIGRYGGFEFFQALLNGSCVVSSYNLISDNLKEEQFDGYHPVLSTIIKNPNLRVLKAETLESEKEQTNNRVKLRGQIKKIDSDIIHVDELQLTIPSLKDKYKYGFQYSTDSDMSQAKSIKAQGNYDSSTLYMNWEAILNEKDLKPNTTYYYRAYMNDGYSDCYGEIKSFTTKGNAEAYYVWNDEDSTAIYYYDGMRKSRGGMTISDRHVPISSVNVIFDISFSNYYPYSFKFNRCSKLRRIENISYLKTDNIDSMENMFYECRSLTSLDLSGFNTSNVTNMGWMFYGCRSLTSLDLSGFNTSNVTNMGSMFCGCYSLTSLDLSIFNTSNVTNMGGMFASCKSLTSLDLSSFNTSNGSRMGGMFVNCSSLTSLDLSSFNTSNVTDMDQMFGGCSSLTSLDLSSFNTSNVTDMKQMFYTCSSLTSLDLSNFNTSNVTSMYAMFYTCSSLTSLDLSSFNTSNVRNMDYMFEGCSSLTSLDLSSFNTSNVTDMRRMFAACESLTSLDLNSFNTSNVTYMGTMFSGCSSLTSLDLSSFNTYNVRYMGGIFQGCSSLKTIFANWKLNLSLPREQLFKDCPNLVGGKGTKIGYNIYDYDQYGNPLYYYCPDDARAAHIDGGKENPGLFTAK